MPPHAKSETEEEEPQMTQKDAEGRRLQARKQGSKTVLVLICVLLRHLRLFFVSKINSTR